MSRRYFLPLEHFIGFYNMAAEKPELAGRLLDQTERELPDHCVAVPARPLLSALDQDMFRGRPVWVEMVGRFVENRDLALCWYVECRDPQDKLLVKLAI